MRAEPSSAAPTAQLHALLLQSLPSLGEQTVAAVVADTQELPVRTPAELRAQLVARHSLTPQQAKAVTDAQVQLLMAQVPGSGPGSAPGGAVPPVDPARGSPAHPASPSALPLALAGQRIWPSVVGSPAQAAWLAFVAAHGATLRQRYPGNSSEQVAIILQQRFDALPPAIRQRYEDAAYDEVTRNPAFKDPVAAAGHQPASGP